MKIAPDSSPGSSPATVSVVVPLYNERAALDELYARLSTVLGDIAPTYEIIFVDDGSTDGSLQRLKEFRAANRSVRFIRFRRNFGKSAALAAGFRAARYRIIVTIDADLQDIPEQLPLMLNKLNEGYDLVCGWRHSRRDRLSKRVASKIYNVVTGMLTGVRLHDLNCGFKCIRREVLDEVMVYGERHRFIPVLASYRGFLLGEVKIDHAPRAHGSSRYGIERVMGGMFSLLTIILMTRYTNKPLHFFGFLGTLLFSIGFVIDAYLIGLRVFASQWLNNRPVLIIGTLLIIVGVQLVLFGLLAEMIAFSYRREGDYSIVETDGEADLAVIDEEARRYKAEAGSIAK
ncbi:MAG TPA: glycosyltransferase family 2 protein [Pyrinomonadaceae bacterium]|nr:glycosyltransferase family 2 protein [Pyrinomonadaceae bacterium]